MQSRRQPPSRWVLHYGNAVFGTAVKTGELSTLGQDVNFLFRMERLAATRGFSTLVSQAAHAELAHLHKGESAGSFPLRGFDGQFSFFRW